MVPKPAQYLLRFDDLCPTFSRNRWERFLPLIEEFGLRPILAVVPDNKDPELIREEPDREFWARMRAMEAAGATIGLHGYQHLCHSHGKGLVPFHRQTEFAGVCAETQRHWIRAGLQVLRDEGLSPRIWVAPRHGFDGNTLMALRGEGIRVLSDGLARLPFTRGGFTWIPQQLWSPVEKPEGLWTICVHPNTASELLLEHLHGFLQSHSGQFTSVERVLDELKPERLSVAQRFDEIAAWWRMRTSIAKRRMSNISKS